MRRFGKPDYIPAKPVWYKGVHYKSTIEARWAVFFECMGIKFIYEPSKFILDYNIEYHPDFLLTNVNWRGGNNFYVEVKGATRYMDVSQKERAKIELFARHYPVIVLGNMPDDPWDASHDDELFSFYFMDGDYYPAFFSKYKGELWLCGFNHEEFDEETTKVALTIAKMAKFSEVNDLPQIN